MSIIHFSAYKLTSGLKFQINCLTGWNMWIKKSLVIISVGFAPFAHANGGFKDIKFGMTLNQLSAIGANAFGKACSPDEYFCYVPVSDRTMFGKPVSSISTRLKAGVVDSVSVTVAFSPREFIGLADVAIGKSKSYSYTGFSGKNVNLNTWSIDETHSIKITYGSDEMDGAYERGLFGIVYNKSTSVEYLNADATKKVRDDADKYGKIDKKDF
jgi:hypothetical protein